MKIIKENGSYRYFDEKGYEILEGDFVDIDGCTKKVYRTVDDELGVDATNPKWIESGKAAECEYGIYPFQSDDTVFLLV